MYFAIQYYGMLVLLSILVAMVLCYVVLYSECLQRLLLGRLLLYSAIQYSDMLVLLSILVTVVLCYVVLCFECLQQLLLEWLPYYSSHAIPQHGGISYCQSLSPWYSVMLYYTLSVYSNYCWSGYHCIPPHNIVACWCYCPSLLRWLL